MTTTTGEDRVRDLMAADAAILRQFGLVLDTIDETGVSLRMAVAGSMLNSQGVCHGGFVFTLADTAAAYAAAHAGARPATVDATISYLRGARENDRLTARARVLRKGNRVGHCDVRVTCDDGEVVAVLRSCWLAGY